MCIFTHVNMEHSGPQDILYRICAYVYCTHARTIYTRSNPRCVCYTQQQTRPFVRAASVYTDGRPSHSHARCQTAGVSRSAALGSCMCYTTQRAPASALRLKLFEEIYTPLANLENLASHQSLLICPYSLLWLIHCPIGNSSGLKVLCNTISSIAHSCKCGVAATGCPVLTAWKL